MIEIKKIGVILFVLILVLLIPRCVYATTLDEIIQKGDGFLGIGAKENKANPAIDESSLSDTSKMIFNILYPIAVAILLGVGIIIGIMFMVGSVETQVKVKEILIPYSVGAIVIFGAFTIWKIVVNIMQSL